MSGAIQFFVPGRPIAQGSKSISMTGGRPRMYDANRDLRGWRELVSRHARMYIDATDREPIPARVPVSVALSFAFDRPEGHFLRSRNLSAVGRRMTQPSVRPDLDKLCRAVLDALTDAGIWHDDSQVCSLSAIKVYADDTKHAGVYCNVARMFCSRA